MRLFRITVARDAPQLKVRGAASIMTGLEQFAGDAKRLLSPEASFKGVLDRKGDWQQFYHLAPGTLVLSEEAWEECTAMYYVCSMGNTELLSIETTEADFRAINPLHFAPLPRSPDEPFDLDHFYAPLFRMRKRQATDLYCLEGTTVEGDEFKHVYDKFGFRGLNFECVWENGC
jgi:hypothetical protein